MRSATLSLFWLRVSKRQNLKLAHIQADLWPNAVLTEISKDKHPQKKFITAFIPLQRADYKISAYTSLTVLALLLVKKKNQVPHQFQHMIFKPLSFFLAATPSGHPAWVCELCPPFTCFDAFTKASQLWLQLLYNSPWKDEQPQPQAEGLSPSAQKCGFTDTVSSRMIHGCQSKRFHNHLTFVFSSLYPIH